MPGAVFAVLQVLALDDRHRFGERLAGRTVGLREAGLDIGLDSGDNTRDDVLCRLHGSILSCMGGEEVAAFSPYLASANTTLAEQFGYASVNRLTPGRSLGCQGPDPASA